MAYITVPNCAEALKYYEEVFGFKVVIKLDGPNGVVVHAEIQFNGSSLFLADSAMSKNIVAPDKHSSTTVGLHLYVDNVDELYKHCIEKGLKSVSEPTDQFWGDRSASMFDKFGHFWSIATHTKNVSGEEMEKAMAAMSMPKPTKK